MNLPFEMPIGHAILQNGLATRDSKLRCAVVVGRSDVDFKARTHQATSKLADRHTRSPAEWPYGWDDVEYFANNHSK